MGFLGFGFFFGFVGTALSGVLLRGVEAFKGVFRWSAERWSVMLVGALPLNYPPYEWHRRGQGGESNPATSDQRATRRAPGVEGDRVLALQGGPRIRVYHLTAYRLRYREGEE